jgi:uncharacterized protein
MRITAILAIVVVSASLAAQTLPPPIIDVHVHADRADSNGPPPMAVCAPGVGYPALDPNKESWPQAFMAFAKKPPCQDPVWGPTSDEEVMKQSIAALKRRNVIGVVSGPLLDRWVEAGEGRVIPSYRFNFGMNPLPGPDEVRRSLASAKYSVLGEVAIQYEGVSPSDERFAPYLAVAEELDVPVAIHIGTGPPGAPYLGSPRYRARLHSALLLEDAIMRHPKLRICVMHAGWPMLDDMLALMWAHPQVYVDTGAIAWALPRREFHRYLQRIVDSGFGQRVMFGSDQMNWPGLIEKSIEAIESADFLTPEQKRDILYNNAARFLRLSQADIARHHGR